jgi:polyphosphate kinase
MVSPFNTRRKFISLINSEIKCVKQGGDGKISIKINNLVDPQLISKLYDAAKKGVKIRIIVRGICCMIPQTNIEIISIVGRFLEHTRFFIFHANGEEQVFLSSADWMQRNLDKRIEVTTPIHDEDIKRELKRIFELQWKDTVKARGIDEFQKNKYVIPTDDNIPLNSQEEIYSLYKSGKLYGFLTD